MSPSRRGIFRVDRAGTDLPLPFSFDSPSLYACSMAALILLMVTVSSFGMISEALYWECYIDRFWFIGI